MALSTLSVQLYSLRVEAARDFTGVLRDLAAVGYPAVEPAGLHDLSPAEFRGIIDDLGLRVSSAHVRLPVGDEANEVLDEQEAIGNTALIAGRRPEDFADADAIARVADVFNEAAANAARRGMTIGYHNHWWEFEAAIDGRCGYDVLVERLDPSVFMEVDIYWVQAGGHDPGDVVRRLGPRARYLHVKDGPLDPPSPMTAVGQGKVDIAGVLQSNLDVQWHVVELDECGTDMFEAVAASHDYLVGNGLSAGR